MQALLIMFRNRDELANNWASEEIPFKKSNVCRCSEVYDRTCVHTLDTEQDPWE